jgi:hypothetical protein
MAKPSKTSPKLPSWDYLHSLPLEAIAAAAPQEARDAFKRVSLNCSPTELRLALAGDPSALTLPLITERLVHLRHERDPEWQAWIDYVNGYLTGSSAVMQTGDPAASKSAIIQALAEALGMPVTHHPDRDPTGREDMIMRGDDEALKADMAGFQRTYEGLSPAEWDAYVENHKCERLFDQITKRKP